MCGRLGNSGLEEQQAAVLAEVVSCADELAEGWDGGGGGMGRGDERRFECLRGVDWGVLGY